MANSSEDKRAPRPPLPSPSGAECAAIAEAKSRVANRRPRFTTALRTDAKGKAELGPEYSDHAGWALRLTDLFGTRGEAFPATQLNHILGAVQNSEGGFDRTKANALLAAVEGARPADELQAMLALQMAVAHELTMQAFRRLHRVDQIPQYDSAGNMAVKLMRAFAGHLELLAKLQNGGRQTVRVEHVHVHPGGQAVVGNVTTGGGVRNEIGSQPHAPEALPAATRQLAVEPSAAVPCQDAGREPVPVSSGEGESAMSDARRREG